MSDRLPRVRRTSLDDLDVTFDEPVSILDRVVVVKGLDEDGEVAYWTHFGELPRVEALGMLDMAHDELLQDLRDG